MSIENPESMRGNCRLYCQSPNQAHRAFAAVGLNISENCLPSQAPRSSSPINDSAGYSARNGTPQLYGPPHNEVRQMIALF